MASKALSGSPLSVSASEWNFCALFFYPLLALGPILGEEVPISEATDVQCRDLAACSMVFIDMYCSSSSLLHHKCSFGLRVEFYARNLSPSGPILGEEVPISEATEVK